MFVRSNVIRFDIGKDTDIKSESCGSMKHQSLGGYFHHCTVTAFIQHLPQVFLHQKRFRCGIGRRDHGISDDCLDGSDQTHFVTGIFQNGFYHVSRCGFSFCSGDSDHTQLISRIIIVGCCHKCHRIPAVLYLDYCHILRHFYRFFHNNCLRSLSGYTFCKCMTIHNGTTDTDKKRTFLCFSGIRNDFLYFLIESALQTCIFQTF